MEFFHSPKKEEDKEIYRRWLGESDIEPQEDKFSYPRPIRSTRTNKPYTTKFTPFKRETNENGPSRVVNRRNYLHRENVHYEPRIQSQGTREYSIRPKTRNVSPESPESPRDRTVPSIRYSRPKKMTESAIIPQFITPNEYLIIYDTQGPQDAVIEILHKIYTIYRNIHHTIENKRLYNLYPLTHQELLLTLADQGSLGSSDEVNRMIEEIAVGLHVINDFSNPDYYEQFVDLFGEFVADSLGIKPPEKEGTVNIAIDDIYDILETYDLEEDIIEDIVERIRGLKE